MASERPEPEVRGGRAQRWALGPEPREGGSGSPARRRPPPGLGTAGPSCLGRDGPSLEGPTIEPPPRDPQFSPWGKGGGC